MAFEFDIKGKLWDSFFTFVLWAVFSFTFSLASSGIGQLLPFWNPLSIFSLALAFLTVFLISVVLSARRAPIVGVAAYLFFPEGTSEQDKTLEYHKEHHYRRAIVNLKSIPSTAYYLLTDSYAWKLIKKHPELWISELDESPKDPNFVKKWCEKKKYQFEPRVPSREDLLRAAMFSLTTNIDHRLDHVQAQMFYPIYHNLISKNWITSKRCILNWSTMMAFPLDAWTMELVNGSKVRSSSTIWIPMPHYVQRWARKNEFEWTNRLPTMKDLLRKRRGDGRYVRRSKSK